MNNLFKIIIFFNIFIFSFENILSQHLPNFLSYAERAEMPFYLSRTNFNGFVIPPSSPVRAVAEWEEMDAIVISWKNYEEELTEIVRNAVEELNVYIVCADSNYVKNHLIIENVDLENVIYIQEASNSVWIRDFGPNNIYSNETDSLFYVDWIYNRPRPNDDIIPEVMANISDIPLYQNTVYPYRMVSTGGNFFTDGFGTAFSSKLVLDENSNGSYGQNLTESDIDTIMKKFMGIERYIKLENLPYDLIHHIDMHMKLIDEETLLVGEYPQGVADGPQIEENLSYILENFNSVFGTSYKIVRIPMPPDNYGDYPDNYGWYWTYTNSLIINKTVLVPIYDCETDEEALNIYRNEMKGYNIIGINCREPIKASGAIHCITHELATEDPLLISHQELNNVNFSEAVEFKAKIIHRTGIDYAKVHFKTSLEEEFSNVIDMYLEDEENNIWKGTLAITTKSVDTLHYYIEAIANSGKTQNRPITAPDGYWIAEIENGSNNLSLNKEKFADIYYFEKKLNINFELENSEFTKITLYDVFGKKIKNINNGILQKGKHNFTFENKNLRNGVYFIIINNNKFDFSKKIIFF